MSQQSSGRQKSKSELKILGQNNPRKELSKNTNTKKSWVGAPTAAMAERERGAGVQVGGRAQLVHMSQV